MMAAKIGNYSGARSQNSGVSFKKKAKPDKARYNIAKASLEEDPYCVSILAPDF
jgi:hypothetical protein